jgi:hypothetical protein
MHPTTAPQPRDQTGVIGNASQLCYVGVTLGCAMRPHHIEGEFNETPHVVRCDRGHRHVAVSANTFGYAGGYYAGGYRGGYMGRDPYSVYVNGRYAGRDPDPNVRQSLVNEYYYLHRPFY